MGKWPWGFLSHIENSKWKYRILAQVLKKTSSFYKMSTSCPTDLCCSPWWTRWRCFRFGLRSNQLGNRFARSHLSFLDWFWRWSGQRSRFWSLLLYFFLHGSLQLLKITTFCGWWNIFFLFLFLLVKWCLGNNVTAE